MKNWMKKMNENKNAFYTIVEKPQMKRKQSGKAAETKRKRKMYCVFVAHTQFNIFIVARGTKLKFSMYVSRIHGYLRSCYVQNRWHLYQEVVRVREQTIQARHDDAWYIYRIVSNTSFILFCLFYCCYIFFLPFWDSIKVLRSLKRLCILCEIFCKKKNRTKKCSNQFWKS